MMFCHPNVVFFLFVIFLMTFEHVNGMKKDGFYPCGEDHMVPFFNVCAMAMNIWSFLWLSLVRISRCQI